MQMDLLMLGVEGMQARGASPRWRVHPHLHCPVVELEAHTVTAVGVNTGPKLLILRA